LTTPQVLKAQDVDPDLLNDFLRRLFPPAKSDFIVQQNKWLHGSDTYRLLIEVDGQIAAYCAVIPSRVLANGQVLSVLWWVDLIIAPEFRGFGLQSIFDQHVRTMVDLVLGFPNPLASKIHLKHGWRVRDDLRVLLLPLRPMRIKSLQASSGLRGIVLRAGSLVLSSVAMIWRYWLKFQRHRLAWRMEKFDAQILADIFQRSLKKEINTTWRDTDYFKWRYCQAPNPDEYAFYLAGSRQAPSHFLIARHIVQGHVRYSRILDIFGDFNDTSAIRELIILAIQDSIRNGSGQVTVLCSIPQLEKIARSLGFIFSSPTGFCWISKEERLMDAFAGQNYWVLADSDNDAPD
jgi:hypothetical protein